MSLIRVDTFAILHRRDRRIRRSFKWQKLFNFGKCKCLHTGHENEDAQYTMGDTVLNTTVKEKDLGLTISADMKV